MDNDLFTYEFEIFRLANIPCDLNEADDSEQQMTHESDDDMEYDPSNVEFTEWDVRSGQLVTAKMMHIVMEDNFENTNRDHKEREYNMEHEDEEMCELPDNQERSVCNIRRFKMVKYSFGENEEYVAVKENEYDDLTSTNTRDRNASFFLNFIHDLAGEKSTISKDEAPEVIITFLKRITVLLQSPVIIIRTDNGTEFKNQVLKVYFDSVGITHQMSSVRTPQQNGAVERRNRTLVEDARTMFIFSRAPLFLWAEAIATACFTQNRSIIHRRFNKTPYELINGRK
nr:putative ribonuclease H-like domain-containing protein [Tanacetum cinerariifolium]